MSIYTLNISHVEHIYNTNFQTHFENIYDHVGLLMPCAPSLGGTYLLDSFWYNTNTNAAWKPTDKPVKTMPVSLVTWDFDHNSQDIPPGKRLHNYRKIHHAIHGKTNY